MDKNRDVLYHLPTLLVHVVIEWPLERMGLSFYDYCSFQSKITTPKHIWGECNLSYYVSCTIIIMIGSIIPHQIGIGKFRVSWYCASIAAPNAFSLPCLLPFNLLQFPSQVSFIYYVSTCTGEGCWILLLLLKITLRSRECVSMGAAGTQTRRSLGHHLLHQLILRPRALFYRTDLTRKGGKGIFEM